MTKAKPFIKWVGGKSQLIEQLEAHLPADFDSWKNATYIEPFIGGGAMLFYMLQRHTNIQHAVINDINEDLTTCYKVVRDNHRELIEALKDIENKYRALNEEEARKEFFLQMRETYNTKELNPIENTVGFFFLNRTCFNGLYRVNKAGKFNVPFGKYTNPQICDAATIKADSELLQKVEIMTGDFAKTIKHAKGETLFYFDPPYRPLSDTSSFNDYSKESFNDDAQIRLKEYCDTINSAGYKFMLSNSDCKGANEEDNFFDSLYHAYNIDRVWASRNINSNPSKRGKLTEILVHNYTIAERQPLHVEQHQKDLFTNTKNIMTMEKDFSTFKSQLQETNQPLDFFCDYKKISKNVDDIKLSLCILNSLIGSTDLRNSVETIWRREKTAFQVLNILIAVREKKTGKPKVVLNSKGECVALKEYFTSVDGVLEFIKETGLSDLFTKKKINNLVDYVFGIETGLDSNARKNRSGKIMENTVAEIFRESSIQFSEQVMSTRWPNIQSVLGKDKKKFDFVIIKKDKTFLIEVNFFGDNGSKLNEVARSYTDIAPKINSVPGFEFVWITDGIGWEKAIDKLQEAYSNIPRVYNLTTIKDFIKEIK